MRFFSACSAEGIYEENKSGNVFKVSVLNVTFGSRFERMIESDMHFGVCKTIKHQKMLSIRTMLLVYLPGYKQMRQRLFFLEVSVAENSAISLPNSSF